LLAQERSANHVKSRQFIEERGSPRRVMRHRRAASTCA
jgi:hypothetical protein